MISYLKGKLVEKAPIMAVVECGSIAFEVKIPLSTYDKLPQSGDEVQLFIHFNISEGDVKLFGFHSAPEKELFKLLLSVNGVGPKLAVSILSSIHWQTFIKYINLENDKALTIVPGLGKKTAQRLILELKDKIDKTDLVTLPEGFNRGKVTIMNEAETALLTLGYKLSEIRSVFEKLDKAGEITSSEELIKKVIKNLYQKKGNR